MDTGARLAGYVLAGWAQDFPSRRQAGIMRPAGWRARERPPAPARRTRGLG